MLGLSRPTKGGHMHELSVIYPIIQIADRIAKENKVEHITELRLLVGELHDIEEKWVNHYYQRFCKGTTLEGSELKIRKLPMVFRCKACGGEQSYTHFEFAGVDLKCNSCACTDMEMLSGRELQIESIEYIDPDKTPEEKE